MYAKFLEKKLVLKKLNCHSYLFIYSNIKANDKFLITTEIVIDFGNNHWRKQICEKGQYKLI